MFQVGAACYQTATEAAHASASDQIGAVVQHGASAYIVNVASVADDSITYSLLPVGGGAAIVTVTPYSAQPCGLLTVQDGLSMGWMVGAAWVGAYALLFVTRALRGDTGGDYGNA
ncbi:hypothetical protein [Rhodoferax ferrireducens]|uniref:hypothetical protein n=1 Tax=Rhodoferax ferrireducens TaxID=192843 RepID=UPI000E0CE8E8|nr:hypothetical protein [Rhodoferax ferrireducens]